jgi:hypothetical protein
MQGDIASYRVKFPFGIAHLSPSAILHSIPSKETPYVRRDGNMVRDTVLMSSGGSSSSTASSKKAIGDKYELLFGTESVYLFLRKYLLLCSILKDIREHVDTFGPSGDPSLEYWSPTSRHSSKADGGHHHVRLDYSTLFTAAVTFFSAGNPSDDVGSKELERVGRIVCKDKLYLVAALPGLVDRCVQAMVDTAHEDAILSLYDYCQYRQSVDPVSVRTHCFSLAPTAVYRIQYDTAEGAVHFNYLPRSVELAVTPPPAASVADALSASASRGMDASEGDPMDDVSSEEDGAARASSSRPSKRAKTS